MRGRGQAGRSKCILASERVLWLVAKLCEADGGWEPGRKGPQMRYLAILAMCSAHGEVSETMVTKDYQGHDHPPVRNMTIMKELKMENQWICRGPGIRKRRNQDAGPRISGSVWREMAGRVQRAWRRRAGGRATTSHVLPGGRLGGRAGWCEGVCGAQLEQE